MLQVTETAHQANLTAGSAQMASLLVRQVESRGNLRGKELERVQESRNSEARWAGEARTEEARDQVRALRGRGSTGGKEASREEASRGEAGDRGSEGSSEGPEGAREHWRQGGEQRGGE